MDTHPEFAQHGSFAHLKLGRAPMRHDDRTLRFAKYFDPALLPAVPDAADYASAVAEWPMYGNDRKGDCTCAAAGHMVQAWSAAAGAPKTPADQDVEGMYIPGTGSDDTGRVELDVLNYWRQTGFGGDKIDAFVLVDAAHVRAAAYLFGGVYIGVALPKTAQGQPEWDLVGDPKDQASDSYHGSWGGHAVDIVAYDADTLTVVTWGGLVKMTNSFHDAYVEERYAIVSSDFLRDGVTPAGFDLAALEADLAELNAQ